MPAVTKSRAASSARTITSPKVKKAVTKPRRKKLASAAGNDVTNLRTELGLSRKVFSRLSHFSERAIANWESGGPLSPNVRKQIEELKRLQRALAGIMDPGHVGEWLQQPNAAFDGFKPLEVIERGHTDRLWRMIYQLESGSPG